MENAYNIAAVLLWFAYMSWILVLVGQLPVRPFSDAVLLKMITMQIYNMCGSRTPNTKHVLQPRYTTLLLTSLAHTVVFMQISCTFNYFPSVHTRVTLYFECIYFIEILFLVRDLREDVSIHNMTRLLNNRISFLHCVNNRYTVFG